jgi:hypothetical protein
LKKLAEKDVADENPDKTPVEVDKTLVDKTLVDKPTVDKSPVNIPN